MGGIGDKTCGQAGTSFAFCVHFMHFVHRILKREETSYVLADFRGPQRDAYVIHLRAFYSICLRISN
jgi:hypothetical protein